MKKQTHSIFWLLSCVRARIPSLLALLLLSMANAELGVLFALGTRGVVNAGTWVITLLFALMFFLTR